MGLIQGSEVLHKLTQTWIAESQIISSRLQLMGIAHLKKSISTLNRSITSHRKKARLQSNEIFRPDFIPVHLCFARFGPGGSPGCGASAAAAARVFDTSRR